MKKKHSIIDTIRQMDIHYNQLREWLHMDYLEKEVKNLTNYIEKKNEKLKDEILLHFKESFINRSNMTQKIHVKNMDVIALFKKLIRKNKISMEEAELYINEWFQYAKENCHSKKLTKKYILLIVSLLFIETSIPENSAAQMLEMQDNQLDITSGKAGISMIMTSQDGHQTQKDINFSQFEKQVDEFIDNMKSKMDDQGGEELVIDMEDMARDFESLQIISPAGVLQLGDLSISGSGKARISFK